jgi:hypothetical protein
MTDQGAITKTATFVKTLNRAGEGRVYRLDPPMEIKDWRNNVTGATEYVWVSAVVAMFSGAETYIFPCDADGHVTDWGELGGSFRGDLDHEEALNGAGYEVAS